MAWEPYTRLKEGERWEVSKRMNLLELRLSSLLVTCLSGRPVWEQVKEWNPIRNVEVGFGSLY